MKKLFRISHLLYMCFGFGYTPALYAVVQFANLQIVDDIFTPNMRLESLALNAFYASGVAQSNADINGFLSNPLGGRTFNPRHYNPLGDDEANISSDDNTSSSTPKNITTGTQVAVRQSRNQSWSSMDLVVNINGDDPLNAIQAGIAKYWATQYQKTTIAILNGVLADNEANDSGDMVQDISAAPTDAALVDANLFNRTDFVNACLTLGDRLDAVTAIAVHSIVYGRMLKNDDIEFIPDSQGAMTIPTYMGKRVIVDDGLTPTQYNIDTGGTPTAVFRYTSVLFGAGAIGIGNGDAKVPLASDRDEAAGDGGGQETIFSRVEYVIHPWGFKWLGASMAGESPTNAELALAANWDRSYERKRVPIAFIKTNG